VLIYAICLATDVGHFIRVVRNFGQHESDLRIALYECFRGNSSAWTARCSDSFSDTDVTISWFERIHEYFITMCGCSENNNFSPRKSKKPTVAGQHSAAAFPPRLSECPTQGILCIFSQVVLHYHLGLEAIVPLAHSWSIIIRLATTIFEINLVHI